MIITRILEIDQEKFILTLHTDFEKLIVRIERQRDQSLLQTE